jgi:hypothetical protein
MLVALEAPLAAFEGYHAALTFTKGLTEKKQTFNVPDVLLGGSTALTGADNAVLAWKLQGDTLHFIETSLDRELTGASLRLTLAQAVLGRGAVRVFDYDSSSGTAAICVLTAAGVAHRLLLPRPPSADPTTGKRQSVLAAIRSVQAVDVELKNFKGLSTVQLDERFDCNTCHWATR